MHSAAHRAGIERAAFHSAEQWGIVGQVERAFFDIIHDRGLHLGQQWHLAGLGALTGHRDHVAQGQSGSGEPQRLANAQAGTIKLDGVPLTAADPADIRRRFAFVDFAQIHFISARHGTGVGDLYESIHAAFNAAQKTLTTSVLTQVLEAAVHEHAPPVVDGRRIKLRYAHAGGHNPPIIVIHGKQTDKIPESYSRYLEKTFRHILKLEGTPVRIQYRSDDNPYVRAEQDMTYQQVAQKRRIKKNRKAPRNGPAPVVKGRRGKEKH